MHSLRRLKLLPILSTVFYTDAADVHILRNDIIQDPVSVNSTVLVLARDTDSVTSAVSVLQGYGISYQQVIVPQEGVTLPILNSSATSGTYGAIVTISELSYDYNNTWQSALTSDQWNEIYAYQEAFGVRLVRLDVFPEPAFGVINNGGVGREQFVSITNASSFGTANIKEYTLVIE